ncbi:hypothetical protein ACJRO7_033917 [Eucalyptus globulus]|uniref:Uncharacterized protein n=1 Tax=Eucalyptus globulus TaxID=34317 RepID=A0ABD3J7J6_EUCGL
MSFMKGLAKAEPVWLKTMQICGFDPPSACVFGQGVLELKESGVSVEEAMAVADQVAKFQGRRPPPNPYPSAIKEIQAGERKYVWDCCHNPEILKII